MCLNEKLGIGCQREKKSTQRIFAYLSSLYFGAAYKNNLCQNINEE